MPDLTPFRYDEGKEEVMKISSVNYTWRRSDVLKNKVIIISDDPLLSYSMRQECIEDKQPFIKISNMTRLVNMSPDTNFQRIQRWLFRRNGK